MGTVRRRNWFTAMGIMFIVVAGITLLRDLAIFGPDFMIDFFTSYTITAEKISVVACGIGGFLIILGLRGEKYE